MINRIIYSINTLRYALTYSKKTQIVYLFLAVVMCLLFMVKVGALENNVKISGNLVAEPCSLDTNSSQIELVFNDLVKKFFYKTPRTVGKPFIIRLIGCDTSIGKTVRLTFLGKESVQLPGLLAPDAGNVKGIAFGIETDDATPKLISLNSSSGRYLLTDGITEMRFRGYVQGEPDAILKQTISPGTFSGTATFRLEYP